MAANARILSRSAGTYISRAQFQQLLMRMAGRRRSHSDDEDEDEDEEEGGGGGGGGAPVGGLPSSCPSLFPVVVVCVRVVSRSLDVPSG